MTSWQFYLWYSKTLFVCWFILLHIVVSSQERESLWRERRWAYTFPSTLSQRKYNRYFTHTHTVSFLSGVIPIVMLPFAALCVHRLFVSSVISGCSQREFEVAVNNNGPPPECERDHSVPTDRPPPPSHHTKERLWETVLSFFNRVILCQSTTSLSLSSPPTLRFQSACKILDVLRLDPCGEDFSSIYWREKNKRMKNKKTKLNRQHVPMWE